MDPFIEICIKNNDILILLLDEEGDEEFIFFHQKSKKKKKGMFNMLNIVILKVFTKF
jgi:hypothetical protein